MSLPRTLCYSISITLYSVLTYLSLYTNPCCTINLIQILSHELIKLMCTSGGPPTINIIAFHMQHYQSYYDCAPLGGQSDIKKKKKKFTPTHSHVSSEDFVLLNLYYYIFCFNMSITLSFYRSTFLSLPYLYVFLNSIQTLYLYILK